MKQLNLETRIFKFDNCKTFAKEINLGAGDLLFTSARTYKKHFKDLNIPIDVMFREEYGTGEPTDVMVDAIIAAVSKKQFKRMIAVGGGSVLDIAKVLALSNGKGVDDLYADMANLEKTCELVIVPTTCGTGTEVTNISILNRTRLNTKMGMVGPALYADYAVLIPELVANLPLDVFATSSIDALVHAVESSLSPKATPFSKLFGYKAIEMIIKGYKRMQAEGLEARESLLEDFLVASTYAGLAFGTAGCAAVHAMSYPLGGKYHVPHGESNYAMFTGVLNRYMGIKTDGEIAVLNGMLAGLLGCDTKDVYTELESLLNQILPKKALKAYGVSLQDIEDFTEIVMTKQQRLMGNNFVTLTAEDVRSIYQSLY